jgi:hypothetical protein
MCHALTLMVGICFLATQGHAMRSLGGTASDDVFGFGAFFLFISIELRKLSFLLELLLDPNANSCLHISRFQPRLVAPYGW